MAKAVGLASGAATGAGALSIGPNAAKASALLLVKWLGIGVIGSAVALGSFEYTSRVEGPSVVGGPVSSGAPVRHDLRPLSSAFGPELRRVTSGEIALEAMGRAVPASLAERPQAAHAVAASTTRAVPSVSDPVTTQLGALDTIRATLLAGHPQVALALLREFDSRNPSSLLKEEVTVLRIDALVDAGREGEAVALAEALLRAHPQSAYGEHVRSKLKSL
jgi:hypothetical protein